MTERVAGTSRRTVAKGMAWSVPVVAGAALAPSASASPRPCVGSLCFGCATVYKCCSGGPQAKYWACVSFTNSGDTDVTVNFSFTLVTSANGNVPITGGGNVPAGTTVSFKPETPRQYGNCSTGTYASFAIDFTDGVNSGNATVPGGSLDGGGNTCPSNTTCPTC